MNQLLLPRAAAGLAGLVLALACTAAPPEAADSGALNEESAAAASQAHADETAARAQPFLAMPSEAALARPLAREHVNLVRVKGDRITDVVFDAQALEVSADKDRGIVFVRVKPAWLASNRKGGVTSAFFNTETENHAVRFVAADVPSQTIELVPGAGAAAGKASTTAREALRAALEAPLEPLAAHDFISALKEIVRASAEGGSRRREPAVGMAFEGEGERVREVDLAQLPRTFWEGYAVRPLRAWVSRDYVCEELRLTNHNTRRRTLEINALAQTVPGVVAVGAEELDFAPGMGGAVYVIRARSSMGALLAVEDDSDSDENSAALFTSEALGVQDDAGKK